jgi:hypothetical protein
MHDTHEQTKLTARKRNEADAGMRSLSIAARDAHADKHGAGYYKASFGPDHSIPEAVAVLKFRHECKARWDGVGPALGL